ncbi:unnamed protein product [Oreochromis niloticus]|nr:unnamed protein product [Mustela putorius furo]
MEDKYLNTEDIEEITAARLYPLIKSFFENLTAVQWHTIRSGDLDIATKSLLGELIVGITEIGVKHFEMMTQNANTEISEDGVLSKMSTIVPQAFAEALETVPQADKESTENFQHLLAKEVVLSIISAQSSDSKTSFGEREHILPPKRLNKMIHFAGRMIRAFISKMNYFSTSTDTSSSSSSSDSDEDTKMLDSRSVPKEYLDQGYKTPTIGPQDSLDSEFLETVKFHIKNAADSFMQNWKKIMSPHYNKEQPQTTEEIEEIARQLTFLVEAKIQCSLERGEVTTPASFAEKCKQSLQNNAGKLKTFFTKQFAKATILRIAKNTRAKFQRKEKVESSESVEELVNDVDLLLQTVKDRNSNEFELFKQISIGKSLEFTQALTDMLNKYAVGDMGPETLPDCFRTAHVNLQVKVFLALMRWWLCTQAESHSQSVMLAILGTQEPQTEPQTQPQTETQTEPQTQPQTETQTETQTQPQTQPQTETQTQPQTQPQTETQTQPQTQPQTETQTETQTQPQTQPQTETQTQPQTQPQTETQTQPQTQPQTETQTQPQTMESIPVVTSQPKPEPFVLDDPVHKAYIKIVLHKLFNRIAKKLKMKCTCVGTQKIHTWLLEEVWGELRDKKLTITPQNLKNLEKYILRDLRNFFGSVETVQVALELQKSTAVKIITQCLTEHLSDTKKKPNAIVRFFTALTKAITKPFRRTT